MKKYLYLIVAVIVGIYIGFLFQPLISGDNVFKEIKKFNFVLNTAFKNYVNDVDSHQLVESAIKGMLNELDVHSVYIPAKDMKSVKEDFQGNFEGIGVEFSIIHDTITVISPIPGGPSEVLGIEAGDKIIKIDDDNAIGIDNDEVRKRLKGPKGTIVKVDISRSGSKKLIPFEITRDKIPLRTVYASFLINNSDIGVVVVNRFAATTHKEMVDSIRKLRKKGMKKLILDLRGNPGGFLSQAFLMADEFIKGGDTIVYTIGRKNEFDDAYISSSGGEFEDIPLIVMVNAGSASASEIVSGAIQDLDRGLIVGTISFGKGLVQRQYEIGDGSAFRLTTSKYYTPSGRCIQRPYKDKDKYRHFSGRLNLEEGSYIHNSLENIKEHLKKNMKDSLSDNIDSLPIYYTKSGRIVLGAGGITPDYIVRPDTLTKFGVQIKMKNMFNEFINDFVDIKSIKKRYDNDFARFNEEFSINDKILNDFKKLAKKKDVEWNEEEYLVDADYINVALKSYIARSIWSRSQYVQVFSSLDKQIKKAVELFPELKKISELRY